LNKAIEHAADDKQIFVLDDEASVYEMLRFILKDSGYNVVSFADEARLFKKMQLHSPKCVFLDLVRSGRSGLEVLKDLVTYPTPVIAMSRKGDIEMAVDAVKGGAIDFVQKPFRREKILSVLANFPEASSLSAPNKVVHNFSGKKPLSYRERQVVQHLVAGLSAKQSAEVLGLSHRTVEDHLARIRQKFGAKNAAALVRAVLAKPSR
jgi:FixJ family two-component response regulator